MNDFRNEAAPDNLRRPPRPELANLLLQRVQVMYGLAVERKGVVAKFELKPEDALSIGRWLLNLDDKSAPGSAESRTPRHLAKKLGADLGRFVSIPEAVSMARELGFSVFLPQRGTESIISIYDANGALAAESHETVLDDIVHARLAALLGDLFPSVESHAEAEDVIEAVVRVMADCIGAALAHMEHPHANTFADSLGVTLQYAVRRAVAAHRAHVLPMTAPHAADDQHDAWPAEPPSA